MRALTFFCLLFILAACATPGQVTSEPRAPTETPPQTSPQPTLTRAPAETPSPQPIVAPAFESGVPLLFSDKSQNRQEIHLVDPTTGQDVPGYAPITLGEYSELASTPTLSLPGKRLAIVTGKGRSCEFYAGGTACRGSADVLHLIDLRAWRDVTATLSTDGGWVGPLIFSPDATRLALIYNEKKSSTLMLFNADSGEVIAQQSLDFRPTLAGYVQDGMTLVVYGQPLGSTPGMSQPDSPRVLLVDAATLEVLWDQMLTNIVSGDWCMENCDAPHGEQLFADWRPAVVLSRDERRLYIVHADEAKLTTMDFDARAVSSFEIRAAQSWFERLLALTADVAEAKGGSTGAIKEAVLSLDGTRLYVIGQTMNAARDTNGNWQGGESSLGLQVIEVETGSMIANADKEATWIRMDGEHLLLGNWRGRWTEALDPNSLQSIARLAEWDIQVAQQMDGQPILLASQSSQWSTKLAVLDFQSFDVIYSWSVDGYASWATAP